MVSRTFLPRISGSTNCVDRVSSAWCDLESFFVQQWLGNEEYTPKKCIVFVLLQQSD
jgi:hypothetical protein